jgi:hypothetical protein
MAPDTVIKYFNPGKDFKLRFLTTAELFELNIFVFQTPKERFHTSIVPAITLPAHTAFHAIF